MATIVDVARAAGVSTATVSRVFNGQPVSEARVQAVRDAAARLGFVPNRTARSLRRRHSDLIALVIPDIENPYFTEVARGAEDVARRAGYSLVLCNSDADPRKEAEYLAIAAAENMAGVLLAAAGDGSLATASAGGLPPAVVAIDRSLPGVDIDEVVMDNREAGFLAARALRSRGFERVACIAGPEDVGTARERAAGAREGGAVLVRHSGFDVAGGRAAASSLLEVPEAPDAIIAANNLIGVGVLQLLAERGLAPDGFGVAVVGSLPYTTLRARAVAIVRLPSRAMGEVAATILLRRVGGDPAPTERVVLRGELIPADTAG